MQASAAELPAGKRPDSAVLRGGEGVVMALTGDWTAPHARALEALAGRTLGSVQGARTLALDVSGIDTLDTLGAWVISRLVHDLGAAGIKADLVRAQTVHRILFDEVRFREAPPAIQTRGGAGFDLLTDIGKAMVDFWNDLVAGVAFLGAVVAALGRIVVGRSRFRGTALIAQLERVGLRSVPIIVLISVLVGGIIAQQSVFQMERFGTAHFVADLMGVLVLRELAVLITSIMIAGRTGSSFTAELGSMKMREEIDALRIMGLDPMEVLVVPRIMALLIGLPLLTFISSMAMLFGGGLVALVYGGVSPEVFMSRLQGAIGLNTFSVGMLKAPFMALVIGIIACIEGFAVQGSADSLGSHTTSSVVKAIFMVIVVDGLFAMFFAAIRY